MKSVAFILSLLISGYAVQAQTKAELEEQRKRALEEISYVDNLIKNTVKERSETLSDLRIINSRLNMRQNIIKGLQEEINLLSERIALNRLAIEMMESDLEYLKKEYANSVVNSFKTGKLNSDIVFILSARDFNQGYKRMKYLQQTAKFRRAETEIIYELKGQIESSRTRLVNDLGRVSELKKNEEQQKNLIESERTKTNRLVQNLTNREKQLQRELEEKRRIARRIESEIARLIEEERKRSVITDLTPEMKLISDNFAENRGRLPWPVERGIITAKFGVQNHPVLKYVTEDNPGINITSECQTAVRSVFRGVVSRVLSITGANMTVIINHGKYFTVYQNLVDVRIKQGDKIETKDIIGSVYCDRNNGNKSVLTFMVYDERVKLDPELWISKKN